jgi:hypothetical protein
MKLVDSDHVPQMVLSEQLSGQLSCFNSNAPVNCGKNGPTSWRAEHKNISPNVNSVYIAASDTITSLLYYLPLLLTDTVTLPAIKRGRKMPGSDCAFLPQD